MSRLDQSLLTAALRHELAAFIHRTVQTVSPGTPYQPNWHIEVIADHLMRCQRGEIKRLIINMPPRSLKSICASVAFPAWLLGHEPSSRIICVSYGEDLAGKLSRDCRAVMQSDWYRKVFPHTRLSASKATELELTTTAKGFRLAVSMFGALTGRGGNIIIIDDPMKAQDAMSSEKRAAVIEAFQTALFSRLDDKKNGTIIVVMQRLHVDDLTGHLLRQGGWTLLNLPAIAECREVFRLSDGRKLGRRPGQALHPRRESLDTLESIRSTIGTYDFSAQYLQNPVPPDGNLVRWDWFKFYDEPPVWQHGDVVVQSWDTASKASELNDYSVCCTFLRRGDSHFLIDVVRVRVEYPRLRKLIVELKQRHQADVVLIEDRGSGTQLIQDLSYERAFTPIAIAPAGDKVTRMAAQSAKIEAGLVLLPRWAPWLADFQIELLQFPYGRHDDQVDAVSQYLGWVTAKRPIPKGAVFAVYSGSVVETEWDLLGPGPY